MTDERRDSTPRLLRREDRPALKAAGVQIQYCLTEEDDAGWSMIEYTAPPQFAAPPRPHWHTREHAFFFILSGSLRFGLADERTEDLGPGDMLHLPPGASFHWSNPSDEPARFLCMYSPAGFERMFEDVAGALRDSDGGPAEVMPRIMPPIWQKYGIES
jgi:mannose-6-phosphate isomerase-like protein (cupin superfamily)